MQTAAVEACSFLGGAPVAVPRGHLLAARKLSPRRCTTVAKVSLVGGDGPLRKAVQPAAALPPAAATYVPLQRAQSQSFADNLEGFVSIETRKQLENIYELSPAHGREVVASGAAAAGVAVAEPAAAETAAPAELEELMALLGDMEDLTSELDSAVASTSDFGEFTGEDWMLVEEEQRKAKERQQKEQQRQRAKRLKAKGTTSSTRATRGTTSAAGSARSRDVAAAAATAAAAEPPLISSRAASGASASTSGGASSAVPFSGAALRSAARTQRARQWGRTVTAVNKGRKGALSKRAAAAASLEADPLTFMRQISKNVLLTADQERRLAGIVQDRQALIEAAAVFRRTHRRPPTEQEWVEAAGAVDGADLRRRLALGLQAREHMVNCNMRLVISIAKKYANRGLALQDLVAEGMVGLQRGVDKFDASKGFKFSTYAHWWIRQAVTRSISDQARLVRLPVHLHEAMGRVRRAEQAIWDETGNVPTPQAVADRCGLPYHKLMALYKAFRTPVSRDGGGLVGSDAAEKSPEEQWVEEVDEDDPLELAHQRMMKEDLNHVLLTLTERECGIIKMRYGLDDGEEKTLEEVGRAFNVTRERIRQIEAKAIRKLRSPSRVGQLVAV